MNLIYKIADKNNIDDLVDLKIKQILFNYNRDGLIITNENELREKIKKVLIQELNKTIYFFVAIDTNINKCIACNGVIIHQMIPDKKSYITSVYTEEKYRCMGIQNNLMKKILEFLEKIECKKIELDAVNPHAIKLYEKFGFQKDNEKYVLNKNLVNSSVKH